MFTLKEFQDKFFALTNSSYTQKELAVMLNISEVTVNLWRSGKRTPQKVKMRVVWEKMKEVEDK